MTTAIDINETRRRYAQSDDDELVRIAFVQSDDFVDEAIALAKDELGRRGINGQDHPLAKEAEKKLQYRIAEEVATANRPANKFLLAACFVLADLVAIIAALLYYTKGRKRAAKQVWMAFGFGWAFRVVLIVILTFG